MKFVRLLKFNSQFEKYVAFLKINQSIITSIMGMIDVPKPLLFDFFIVVLVVVGNSRIFEMVFVYCQIIHA